MYKPIKEETIVLLELNKSMILEFDTTRNIRGEYSVPYKFTIPSYGKPTCQCHIRWAKDYIAVDDLDIGADHEGKNLSLQELFLTLAVKELIKFTDNSDRLKLLIYFNNPMLQLILLDHNFSVRKSLSHESGTHRAKLKL